MPHIFSSFKKANLKTRKIRKPRNLLDVAKMKPEKMPTPTDIFGKDLHDIRTKKLSKSIS